MDLSSSFGSTSPQLAFRLVGELDGQAITFVLSSSVMTIGAHPENELVIAGPGISRRHAVLSITPDGVIVEDQESKNGTWVNGRRSTLAKILPGDEVSLGAACLRLEQVHPEDAQVAMVFDSFDPGASQLAPSPGTRTETDLWARESDLSTQEEITSAPVLEWLDDLTVRLATDTPNRLESTLEAIIARLDLAAAALIALPPGEDPAWVTAWGSFDRLRAQLQRHESQVRSAADTVLSTRTWHLERLSEGCVGMTPVARNEVQLLLLVADPFTEPDEPLIKLLGTLIAGVGALSDQRRVEPASRRLSFPDGYLEGRGEAMLRLYKDMEAVADSEYPVLVLGETGSGKEMISQTLHRSSRRAAGNFVTINCAAIPADLLEAEMFGVTKGAATGVSPRQGCFARAHHGTLFLDEIGELHMDLQAKLLRALEYGEVQPVGGLLSKVDVRVIAATNVNLEQRIEQDAFRADLYYRLAADVVRIPALRRRSDDLPLLIQGFVQRFANARGVRIRGISQKALDLLLAYTWPGNVRELQHELRRAVYRATSGQVLDSSIFGDSITGGDSRFMQEVSDTETLPAENTQSVTERESLDLRERLAEVETALIREALRRTDGNKREAAKLLGISRNTLAAKAVLYGIT